MRGLPGAAAFFVGLPVLFFVCVLGLHAAGLAVIPALGVTLIGVVAGGYVLEKRF